MLITNSKLKFIVLFVILSASFTNLCMAQKEKAIMDFKEKLECTEQEAILVIDAAFTFVQKIENGFNRIATGDTTNFGVQDERELLGFFADTAKVYVSVIGKSEISQFPIKDYIRRLRKQGKRNIIKIEFSEKGLAITSPIIDEKDNTFTFSASVIQIFKAISRKNTDKINYADVCKKIFNFKGELIDGAPVLIINSIGVSEAIPMKKGWEQRIQTIKN